MSEFEYSDSASNGLYKLEEYWNNVFLISVFE